MWCLSFSVWLIPFSIMPPSFIHVVTMKGFPSFSKAEYSIHTTFSVSSPLLVNAQVVSIPGYCEICCRDHGSTDCLLEVLISYHSCIYPEVGLLDHLVVLFLSFLRNFYVIFHSGYIIYILSARVPVSLHPYQYLLSHVGFIIAILRRMS